MKYLTLLTGIIILMACNSKKSAPDPKDPPSGGGCTYKHDTVPATVVKIVPQYDDWKEVLLSVGKDTLYYSREFSGYVRDSTIKERGLVVGAQFQYIISDIISGHCTPHIKHLTKDKYIPSEKDVK